MREPARWGAVSYCIGFVILAIVFSALYHFAAEQARRNILHDTLRAAEFRAEALRNWLDTKAYALGVLRATIEEVAGDGYVPQEFLSAYKHDPELRNVVLGLNDGLVISGMGAVPPRAPEQDTAWFEGALHATQHYPQLGPFVPARVGDGMVFTLSTPLRYRNGRQRGVLAFSIAQATVADRIQAMPSEGGRLLLIDGYRKVIVSEDAAAGLAEVRDLPGAEQLFEESRSIPKGILEVPLQGVSHIFAYSAVGATNWVLAVHIPERVALGSGTSLHDLFLFFCVLAAVWIGYLSLRTWQHDRYKELSLIDQLTQAGSRTAYDRAFDNLQRRAEYPVALILCDLDNLKVTNDTLGHENGDRQLQRFSAALRGCLRGGDAVFRLGGDEFVILLPGANLATADRLIRRINNALLEDVFVHPDDPALEASIGAALAVNSAELETLFRRADEAMYAQKMARKSRAETVGGLAADRGTKADEL
jgi:diguanylate cyclase (GGDEF)-like protein